MKKNKTSYFVGIAFLCIIAVFFCSVCYRVYRVKKCFDYGIVVSETADNKSQSGGDSSQTNISYNWQEKYPFSDEYKFKATVQVEPDEEKEPDTQQENTASGFLAAVNGIKDSIDYYTTKLLPGRMKYVELNALFNRAVGMNIVSGTDSVVVMKNGYLTFENNSSGDASTQAESVKWFSDIMKEKGIDFMYVQYPTKEKEGDGQLPPGVNDGANKMADDIISGLSESGVKCFDMRVTLAQKDDDWYSNFFKTDHHWKPETGVWASGQIAKLLNLNFGYSLDESIGDINNYNIDVYKDYCLGAQGKVATLTFADPEDISLIYPKKKTSITVQYNDDTPITGRFEDVLFNRDYLNNTDYYSYSAYSAYLNGNKALSRLKNNDCKNGKRILVIGGSFNKSVVPYLSQTFEYTDLLDRRYFDGSVIDYIDKTKPDTVIIAYTPILITEITGHNSTFNFE